MLATSKADWLHNEMPMMIRLRPLHSFGPQFVCDAESWFSAWALIVDMHTNGHCSLCIDSIDAEFESFAMVSNGEAMWILRPVFEQEPMWQVFGADAIHATELGGVRVKFPPTKIGDPQITSYRLPTGSSVEGAAAVARKLVRNDDVQTRPVPIEPGLVEYVNVDAARPDKPTPPQTMSPVGEPADFAAPLEIRFESGAALDHTYQVGDATQLSAIVGHYLADADLVVQRTDADFGIAIAKVEAWVTVTSLDGSMSAELDRRDLDRLVEILSRRTF